MEGDRPAGDPGRHPPTILIVEDDDSVRRSALRFLRRKPCRVIAVAAGEDAIGAAFDEKRSIDVLLTDIDLPDTEGARLAEVLRAMHPGVAIVYTSGRPRDEALEDLDALEAEEPHRFLPKPYELDDLWRVLSSALEEGDS